MASSTWVSSAMGERESLARDSVIRMMASSWRIVMGMEERALAEISAECTCRRMATKWEESFSPASGERRGAQRLERKVSFEVGGFFRGKEWVGWGGGGGGERRDYNLQ